MIGRFLSLQDTGAPAPEAVRRRVHSDLPALPTGRPIVDRVWPAMLGAFQMLAEHLARMRRPVRFWREFSAVSLLLMGLSWAVPWFQSLTKATFEIPAGRIYLVLFALAMAAFITARIAAAIPGRRRWIVGTSLAAGMLVGLKTLLYAKEVVPLTALVMRPLWAFSNFSAMIPNELIVVAVVLLTWRRGAVLSLDYIGPERVRSEFKTGFGMLMLFTALNTFVTTESVAFEFLGSYILFGLLAMGAARMATVGELRGGQKTAFNTQRLVAVVLGAGLSAMLAYWIGFNFAKDGAVLAGFVVGGAILSVFIVSIPLLLALLYLMYGALSLFEEELSIALGKLSDAIKNVLAVLEQLKEWLQMFGELLAEKLAFLAPIFRWLLSLTPLVRNLVIGGALLAAAAGVYLALYIRARRLRESGEGQEETIPGMSALLAALKKRFLLGLSERRSAISDALDFRARYRRTLANRIRKVYMDLLDLAEDLGHPRPEAQTPLEFQESLARLFSGRQEDVRSITAAYIRIRYGELPEDLQEARSVELALMRVRAAAGKKKQ